MEVINSDSLMTLAEVSAGTIGFSAIATVLSPQRSAIQHSLLVWNVGISLVLTQANTSIPRSIHHMAESPPSR